VDVQAEIEKQFAEEEAKSAKTVQAAIDAAQELETARVGRLYGGGSDVQPALGDGRDLTASEGSPLAEAQQESAPTPR